MRCGDCSCEGVRRFSAAGRDSDGTTVFVKGFDRYLGGEDEVRRCLLGPLLWGAGPPHSQSWRAW